MTRLLILLSAFAFVSLGLPDGLLGVAWPSMRIAFGRDLDALGVLLVTTTAGYIIASFSSGRVLRHVNLGAVLALSCLLTAFALVGYATSRDWRLVVALGFVLGAGGGGIDAALNTYAATNHGPRTLNLLHACYGLGASLGPIIMTAVLSRGRPWQRGYAIVGVAQLMLAAAFATTIRRWPTTSGAALHAGPHATLRATLARPATLVAALAFIVYAGVEASIGAWTYTLLTLDRGLSASYAGGLVSTFWGGLTAGRLMAAMAGGLLPTHRLLQLATASVLGGTLLLWLGTAPVLTLAGVALAGGACGPIFPTLVATTPLRLDAAHTANAVGIQIAASGLGLSIVPALVGIIADATGVGTIAPLLVGLAILLLVVYDALDRVAPIAPPEPRTR